MQLEAVKPKNPKEGTLETEVFNAGKDEIEADKAVDRLKAELKINEQKEREIKNKKEIEDLRQGLGLEKEEDQEVFIETDAFLKKLAIPFEDEGVDKKRQELLKETQDKINPKLKGLEENKKTSLDIKREKEELAEKIKNFEILKAEKERELEILRNEAREYVDKTKPPIIRASTKEKLARAKGVIQYFEKKDQGEDNPFFDYDKAIGADYRKNAEGGFDETREKSDEIKKIASESYLKNTQNQSKDIELRNIEENSQSIISIVECCLKENSNKLESLKNDQEKIDKRKERIEFVKKTLSGLLPEKDKNPKEINPIIAERKKVTKERSERNIIKDLDLFLYKADNGYLEKLGIKNKEEAIEGLREEVKKVQESVSITINLGSDSLFKILDAGRFKSTLEQRPEDRKRGFDSSYDSSRIQTEEAIGVYTAGTEEDPYTIVGAIASNNGYDESNGGAGYYGDVFMKLKPEVIDRSVFINGDSIAEKDRSGAPKEKLEEPGLDKEAAMLAKAIRNIGDKSKDRMGQFLEYIEANILGGVKMDDIESINIKSPAKFLEKYNKTLEELKVKPLKESPDTIRYKANYEYECYKKSKKLIEGVKEKFPQYAHLINEVLL